MNALFITGTDTGVGKTAITGMIARLLQREGIDVGVAKPVATGCRVTDRGRVCDDVEFLHRCLGFCDPREITCTYAFETPVSPHLAAKIEGRPILLPNIISNYFVSLGAHDLLLIEGVGGLMVPLTETQTVADLIQMLKTPVLLVSRNLLGTLNHTLLTLRYLKDHKIPVLGVIMNHPTDAVDASQDDNASTIARFGGAPILGAIPYCPGLSTEKNVLADYEDAFRSNLNLEPILEYARTGTLPTAKS